MFINIRDKFCKELERVSINLEKSCWDFYTNSTAENLKRYEEAQDEYSKVFQNRDWYNKFLAINKDELSKHEQKQLKELLKEFDEELNTGEELKALRKKENEIAQKYNSYIPKIDGKEVSKPEIFKIMQTETNPDLRKKAYDAKIKGADLIAEDMIEFVKMRNEYAKNKGYGTYFEYKLKEDYDVDLDFLNKLIDEVYTNASGKIKEILEKKQKELKEFFGVEKLENYHYGLLLNNNPEKGVNKILEASSQATPPDEKGVNKILEASSQATPPDEKGINEVLINQDIVSISKTMYKNMGYDIDKLEKEGKITLDLFARKGKNTHGFCFGVEAGKDSRILANLINNVTSLDTLNHELGHCVYDLGISTELPFLDRRASSPAVTEAVAMMMGDIIKTENVLDKIVPDELLERFKMTHKEASSSFVAKSLLIIDFEREIYTNPEQNPAELWNNLNKKYLNRENELDNEWASIPHYLSHPAYYQNYFRANLMKVQIYNYLKSVLGNITENNKSAEFMDKNIFELGASVEEYDLIKQLTGEEFSAKEFCNNL
ncbi:MAG: hypothetical protein KIC88_01520 [Acinetobacter sp.]|nr:hypothetical protein [Acinetobacter sp.]